MKTKKYSFWKSILKMPVKVVNQINQEAYENGEDGFYFSVETDGNTVEVTFNWDKGSEYGPDYQQENIWCDTSDGPIEKEELIKLCKDRLAKYLGLESVELNELNSLPKLTFQLRKTPPCIAMNKNV